MVIPNILSFSRIFLGIGGFFALYYRNPPLFLLVIILGVLTDYLDGKLARSLKISSMDGFLIDNICDQLFEFFLCLSLYVFGFIPIYFFSIVSLRVLLCMIHLYIIRRECRESENPRHFRFYSLLTIITFFLFGLSAEMNFHSEDLTKGFSEIALSFVFVPSATLVEFLKVSRLISYFLRY